MIHATKRHVSGLPENIAEFPSGDGQPRKKLKFDATGNCHVILLFLQHHIKKPVC